MYLVYIILCLTFIIGVTANTLNYIDTSLFFISTIITIHTLDKVRIFSNLCKYIVFGVFIISVVIMPSWHLVTQRFENSIPNQLEIDKLLSFGTHVYFVSICAFLLSTRLLGKVSNKYSYKIRNINDRTINLLFIILFPISFFCFALGIGRMGAEAVVLPFHLSGIINMFRRAFVPGFIAVYVENKLLKGEKVKKSYILLYFTWTLVEMLAWLSKSVVIDDFLPLIIVVVLYYKPTVRQVLKYTSPLLLVFLFMYPIIGVMRSDSVDSSSSIVERISSAKKISDEEESENGGPLLKPLNRMFMAPSLYIADNYMFDESSLFDFSNLPMLILFGGAPEVQTRVVDGYPEWAHHSSGTAGLIDPLMHGGYGLCYIMIFILLLFAGFIDRLVPQGKYSAFAILTLLLWRYSAFANISSIYGVLGIVQLSAKLVPVIFAYKYNYCK